MNDRNETEADKINRNVELLRQVFEPLPVGLTPDVEPAVTYFLPFTVRETKTSHDD